MLDLSSHCGCGQSGACRICVLVRTDRRYAELFGVPFTGGDVPKPRSLPCIHDDETIHTFCPRGDAMLHVRGCEIHSTTTRQKCLSCNDYSSEFDRVVLVNLKRRPDRLRQFRENLRASGWRYGEPAVFEAVDGSLVPIPPGFQSGAGALGCRQSHARILERAIQDGVESLMVFEDDAVATKSGIERLEKFMSAVPQDWDQLMLGGQHMRQPEPVSPGIVRVWNCQRTHAYAIRRPMMKRLYEIWSNCQVHIDWKMGEEHPSWKVYAPEPFVFAQENGVSDITLRENPRKTWGGVKPEAIAVIRSKSAMAELRSKHGWWGGANRNRETDVDVGLDGMCEVAKMATWIELVGSESDGVLAVYHPTLPVEFVQSATHRKVIEIAAGTAEEALNIYEKNCGTS